jgi:hypothetical protein
MSDINTLPIARMQKRIEETYYCTTQFPLEIVQIVCAFTIDVCIKNYSKSDYEKTKTIKICCFVNYDLGDHYGSVTIPNRCLNDNRDCGGSICIKCEQWICHLHKNTHKFCISCGKQMFSKLEREIDGQLDTKEIIDQLFLEEEEKTLSVEEEKEKLYYVEELESIEESQPEGPQELCLHNSVGRTRGHMICRSVDCITWTDSYYRIRCDFGAVKYCSDCKMCFCSGHQYGFCRCGKVVSFYERSKLLQKQCDTENAALERARLYYLKNQHEWNY